MDATRFDAIAKALIARSSRRRTLGGLLGGTLALLGFAATGEAAPDGTCKPKCGKCERCKKGTCRQTPHGRRCAEGKCKPKPNGQRCGKCKECKRGECVVVEDGTECSSDNLRRCFAGECVCVPGAAAECDNGTCIACGGPQRTNPIACTCCGGTGETCTVGGNCCSGICNTTASPGNPFCQPRREDDPCQFDSQCASQECRANGTCAP